MNDPTPWVVVSHAADDSRPAIAVSHLMAWLSTAPDVELHTVLWAAGPAGTKRYDFGRLADVGADHLRLLPRALRQVGLGKVGGGLAGRAVRRTVRDLPRHGVLYLSTAHAGAVVRYLPPGDRTVVTHLHGLDRRADPPLPADKVDSLRAITDVWLATDEETRAWAAEEWDIPLDAISIVPEPVDPTTWTGLDRPTDPNQLRLGLSGGAWFRSDHSARLVQSMLRLRPGLDLDLVWPAVVPVDHLAPILHDLELLDVRHRLELPSTSEEVLALLDGIDVLALTTPDEEAPWLAWEAALLGVPVVCFDSHHQAPKVKARGGVVVPYLDIVGMAEAVLAIHENERATTAAEVNERKAELARRDVNTVGPLVLGLAGSPT